MQQKKQTSQYSVLPFVRPTTLRPAPSLPRAPGATRCCIPHEPLHFRTSTQPRSVRACFAAHDTTNDCSAQLYAAEHTRDVLYEDQLMYDDHLSIVLRCRMSHFGPREHLILEMYVAREHLALESTIRTRRRSPQPPAPTCRASERETCDRA